MASWLNLKRSWVRKKGMMQGRASLLCKKTNFGDSRRFFSEEIFEKSRVYRTKLYLRDTNTSVTGTLPSGTQAGITPSFSADKTANIKTLSRTKSTGGGSHSSGSTDGTTNVNKGFMWIGCTPALKFSQRIGGATFNMSLAGREDWPNANFLVNGCEIYIWRPSTGTKVGTIKKFNSEPLFGKPLTTNNSTQTYYNKNVFADLSPTRIDVDNYSDYVVAEAGDILVLEVWSIFKPLEASALTVKMAYDGSTESIVQHSVAPGPADFAAFIEFEEQLVFSGEGSTYYVDQSTGSNSNSGTSEGSPWLTINYAVNNATSAGDTIYVKNGIYNEVVSVPSTARGVNYKNFTGHTPWIDGNAGTYLPNVDWSQMLNFSGEECCWEGINIRNSNVSGTYIYGAGATINGNRNVFKNFTVHTTWGNGFFIKGDFNVADGITMHDASRVTPDASPPESQGNGSGISAARGGGNNNAIKNITGFALFRNLTLYENYGETLSFLEAYNCLAENCVVYDSYAAHIYISNAKNCIVRNNLVYKSSNISLDGGFSGSTSGITLADEITGFPSYNNLVFNNLQYNCELEAFYWSLVSGSGLNKAHIAYNTIIDGAIKTRLDSSISNTSAIIENNICYSSATDQIGSNTGLTLRNNCWYPGNPTNNNSTTDTNSNPLLNRTGATTSGNLNDYYFKIAATSPVIGQGRVVSGISDDYFGTTRDSSTPDIGAFEYTYQSLIQTAKYTNSNTFYSHTISNSGFVLSASLYVNSNSFYSQTVQPGSVTLSPNIFSNSSSFYTPKLSLNIIQASKFNNSNNFYSLSIIPGSFTISPSIYTNNNTIYSHIVSPGSITLTPSVYNNTSSFYSGQINLILKQSSKFDNSNTFYNQSLTSSYLLIQSSTFNDSDVVYSSSVIPSAITLTVPLYNNSNSFYSHKLNLNLVQDSKFNNNNAFYSTNLLSTYTLTPNIFVNTNNFYTPKLNLFLVQNSIFNNSNVFYQPSITQSGFLTQIDSFVNSNSFYTQSLIPGSVSINPTILNNSQAFYNQHLNLILTQSSRYDNNNQFYNHVLSSNKLLTQDSNFGNSQVFYNSIIDLYLKQSSIFVNNNNFYNSILYLKAIQGSKFDNANNFYNHNLLSSYTISQSNKLDNISSFYGIQTNPISYFIPSLFINNNQVYNPTIIGSTTTLIQDSTFNNLSILYAHIISNEKRRMDYIYCEYPVNKIYIEF